MKRQRENGRERGRRQERSEGERDRLLPREGERKELPRKGGREEEQGATMCLTPNKDKLPISDLGKVKGEGEVVSCAVSLVYIGGMVYSRWESRRW